MHHPQSKTVRTCRPQREVRRIPVGTRPDLAALVPALGLVPGVDSFVLLDREGWGTRMLAFDPERVLSVGGDSPFGEVNLLADVSGPLYCLNSIRGIGPVVELDGGPLRSDAKIRSRLDGVLVRRSESR